MTFLKLQELVCVLASLIDHITFGVPLFPIGYKWPIPAIKLDYKPPSSRLLMK